MGGYHTRATGQPITADNHNTYIRDQTLNQFASVSARDSAIVSGTDGMYATTLDADYLWRHNGSKWLRQEALVVKTADTSFSLLTTLTDDATLLFPVDINSTYWFEFELLWSAGATPKYAHALKFPASCRMDYSRSGLDSSAAMFRDAQVNVASGSSTTSAPTAGGTGSSTFRGIIVTGATSGNVVFQAAQGTSNATTCTTQRGSFVKHWQVA